MKRILFLVISIMVIAAIAPFVLSASAANVGVNNCDAYWTGYVYDKESGSCKEVGVSACEDPFMFHDADSCNAAVQEKEAELRGKQIKASEYGAMNEDDCIALLKEKYPSASQDRLENACGGVEGDANRQINVQAQLTGTSREEVMAQISNKMGYSNSEFSSKLKSFSDSDLTKFNNLGRAQMKSIGEKDPAAIAELLKSKQTISLANEDWFKNRVLTKDELKNLKQEINQKMNNFDKNLKLFETQKNSLGSLIASGDEAAIIAHVKEMLINGADLKIDKFEEYKLRIQAEEELSSEEVSMITSAIDEAIATIEEYKGKVSAAQTKDELKALATELRELWNDKKDDLEFYKHILIKAKVEEVLKKSIELEVKFDQQLEELKTKAVEAGATEAQLDEFSSYVESARTKLDQAREKGYAFLEQGDMALLDEAKQLVQSAKQDLEKAKVLAQEIAGSIEELGGSFSGRSSDINDTNVTVDIDLPDLPGLPPSVVEETGCESVQWEGYVYNSLTQECESLVSEACENPFDYESMEACEGAYGMLGGDNETNTTSSIPLPPPPPSM